MKFKSKLFILLILCIAVFVSRPAESQKKVVHDIALKGNLGAQIFSQYVIYESGINLSYSADFKIGDYLLLGPGVGFDVFEDINLLPLTLNAKVFLNPNASTVFFNSQVGYSISWDKSKIAMSNYEYLGGLTFSIGGGYRIKISQDSYLLFNLSYRHQYNDIKYTTFGGRKYIETTNYDFITVGVGILF
ncbi:MAG: hypothetical protein KAH48_01120 [Chlorobi bacterium]|nr:hypothetical protein [Chlorobiota bacterium]